MKSKTLSLFLLSSYLTLASLSLLSAKVALDLDIWRWQVNTGRKLAVLGLVAGLGLFQFSCNPQPRVVVVTATPLTSPTVPLFLPTLPVPTATLVFEKAASPTPQAKLRPTAEPEATKEEEAEKEDVWDVDAGYPPLP